MTLRNLLAEKRIRPHTSSSKEISDLFKVVDRDIRDAKLASLSPDRGFATAYNGILQLATIVLRGSGYRTAGGAHHWATFHVLPELFPQCGTDQADYFDACRRKRNIADYDAAGMITNAEVKELLSEASAFRKEVISWLKSEHPELI